MPTLRSLECLIAVLEAESVTVAAARLHASQPAVSHQLAALEREIGTPLVERLPRGVRPTVAGRAVAAHARAALAAANGAVDAGRSIAEGHTGHLRIACAESMTTGLLPPVLRAWRQDRPGVHLSLIEATSADALARAVEADHADLAVGPRPTQWAATATTVGVEEVVLALPTGHPLAAATHAVPFAHLAGQPFVHYHHANGLAGWLDVAAAEHGITLSVVMRTRQTSGAAQLAAAGLGVALVPTTALPTPFPGALRRLDPPLTRDIVALVGSRSDRLVNLFVRDLQRHGVPVPAEVADKLPDDAFLARDGG